MVWRLSDTCGSASSGRYFIFIPRGVNNTISDTSEGTIYVKATNEMRDSVKKF
jgi:hypothetical protein